MRSASKFRRALAEADGLPEEERSAIKEKIWEEIYEAWKKDARSTAAAFEDFAPRAATRTDWTLPEP